jgi:hypothetical protein
MQSRHGQQAPPGGFVAAAFQTRPVRDVDLSARSATAALRSSIWGGVYRTSTGETIRMYADSWYYVNSPWLQGWADWMAKYLVHRDEFSRVTVLFVPPWALGAACGGADAAGCYSRSDGLMIVPGNQLSDGTRMDTVVVHEYGHHVAANRQNPPWDASDWGPKYWASYASVCQRVASGTAFPGDEGLHYLQNPGEAWAETYRLAVWRSWLWIDWPEDRWNSDPSFYPTRIATDVAKQDVLNAWIANGTTRTWTGGFTKKKRARTLIVNTPYDGDMAVTLYRPIGATLTLIDGASGAILQNTSASFSYRVCGQRSLHLRVTGRAGRKFRVTISAP